MKKAGLFVAAMSGLATLGVLVAVVVVAPASAHSDPCHFAAQLPFRPSHLRLDRFVDRPQLGLIPLELGGAARNPKNLWPEPRTQSRQSDPLETKLKRQVCQDTLTLAAARAAILEFKFAHG